jgi:excisionase family DNA binding protein
MAPKSKPVPDKLAYTIPEAAAKMSTNEWFVRKMIHENKLKFVPGGKEFLIPHQAILDFLAAEARTYSAEPK